MTSLRIDLNCDAGEGAGRDAELMPHITSVNIACGAHAGDAFTMRDTLLLAAGHGVAAGAHPSYPDRVNFGRRHMNMTAGEIYETVAAQIAVLRTAAASTGTILTHVKPHGALYNDAAVHANIARAIVRAVFDADAGLLLFGLAGSRIITEAELIGVRAVPEAFADRTYAPDGTLTPRNEPGAMIDDPAEAAVRVVRMVEQRVVESSGRDLRLQAETICIHGDGPRAVEIASAARAALDGAGVRVAAPGAQ